MFLMRHSFHAHILGGYLRMRMDILGYVEIESRIVDEYKCVGLPLHNVALALCHIAEDGGQMHKYGHKAHVCQLTIVTHTYSSDIRHLVATEETELGGIVYTAQGSHKVRSVQVARGFANNQVVSHISIQNSQFKIGAADNSKLKTQNSKLFNVS